MAGERERQEPERCASGRELIVPGADSLRPRLRIRKRRSLRKLHVRFPDET